MPRSPKSNRKSPCAGDTSTESVRPLAAEEIRLGAFVVVLRETAEYPAVLWFCDAPATGADTVLRIALLPDGGGVPRRVEAIYLPFVLVKPPRGAPQMLDVRRHKIARVDRHSARAVWRALRKADKNQKAEKGDKAGKKRK